LGSTAQDCEKLCWLIPSEYVGLIRGCLVKKEWFKDQQKYFKIALRWDLLTQDCIEEFHLLIQTLFITSIPVSPTMSSNFLAES